MDVITTIGPASWGEEVISGLLAENVNAIRFPFSKETPQIHLENALRVKEVGKRLNREVHLIADLPGAKPRLSNARPLEVVSGKVMKISLSGPAASADLSLDPALPVSPPDTSSTTALVGDGEYLFQISTIKRGIAEGFFVNSGTIERRLAFTVPGLAYRIGSCTESDRHFCTIVAHHFDSVALSFTQSASEVTEFRNWLSAELSWRPRIIAKIESVTGVANAEEIARVADAVMIARGDLALQVGIASLWNAQNTVMKACRATGTYIIVATGLLESLIKGRMPSRSEAIDVAVAADSGANALLLSAETTIGINPVHAVKTLRNLVGENGVNQ